MHSPGRRRARALVLAALSLALAAAACGPGGSTTSACAAAPQLAGNPEGWGPPVDPPTIAPVIINGAGQLVCGQNRLLFTLLDPSGRPIGAPDRTARLAIFNLGRDAGAPVATVDGEFVWAIEDSVGIYVAQVAFPESGRYGAEVTTTAAGAAAETQRLTFDVQPSTSVVRPGDPAPASKTPTLEDAGGDPARISTDSDPEPALYETSVDEALAAKEPFVVIFATPKFCKTAQCGPTLDRIKPFIEQYPSVTFINVEPYKLKPVDGTLEPDLGPDGQLQPVGTSEEWHLVNEPTVYVVDRNGVVTANFELIFSDRELTAALDAVK
jgi:hypothetical protein